MNAWLQPVLRALVSCAAFVAAWPAVAAYDVEFVDYPGADCTRLWGVAEPGIAVGWGGDCTGTAGSNFKYDLRTHVFTPLILPPESFVVGVNQRGQTVGGLIDNSDPDNPVEKGFIRERDGTIRTFVEPAWPNSDFRSINDSGLVTGYSIDGGFEVAFVFDSRTGRFADVRENGLAHGINARGQVVGDSYIFPDDPDFPGFFAKVGWLRDADGKLHMFRVRDRRTWARAISDTGLIAGYFTPVPTCTPRGCDQLPQRIFTLDAKALSASLFQEVDLAADASFELPGMRFTLPEGITNAGVIIGMGVDAAGLTHGFVATPVPASAQ